MAGSAGLAPPTAKTVAELALTRRVKACLEWFRQERKWINEQHLEVCRIPAPTFLEEKRAEWMVARLKSIGWDARLDRAGNVVAFVNGGRDGPLVALTAHLDTVLAPRSPEEITVGPEGRFRGPGVSDNGAGLAALLAVAAAWKRHDPLEDRTASLVLVANVGEEGEGNLSGMRHLCRQSALGGHGPILCSTGRPRTTSRCRRWPAGATRSA
jgi:acetylornithine deacetylase/succinyl-diaminopimelate desuccinylase-like protein